MALTPISGEIQAQPLNDNFSSIDNSFNSVDAQLADIAINVKSFGAKGDGIADDYGSIQNAINSLGVNGGKILFPKGTYLLSKPLVVSDYTTLEGTTKSGCVLKRSTQSFSDVLSASGGSVDCVIHISGTVLADNLSRTSYGNKITNLYLLGYSTTLNNLTAFGIYCHGLSMSDINHVRMEYVEKGLFSQSYIWDSELKNIWVNICYSGFEVWSATSLLMTDCYASNYRDFGYICNNWIYSHMSNCACDSGGNRTYWADTTILSTAYKFRNCKGFKVTSGGSEGTNGLALHLENNTATTIENMLHLNLFSDYDGTLVSNIVGAYRISEGSNVKLENNLFEYKPIPYTGVGVANFYHYKRYVSGVTEGLQLINNKIINCTWLESGATSNSMDLSGIWLSGNVSTADSIIYVNNATGNDFTGLGTIALPYKTIKKAISLIPRVNDHIATIQLQDGDYLDNPVMSGIGGKGEIIFQGNVTNPVSTRIKGTTARPTQAEKNTCKITFNSVGLYSNINAGVSLTITDNPGIVEVKNCLLASWSGAFVDTVGILAIRSPFILSTNNGGTTTKTALKATQGSTIIKNGTQPTGAVVNEEIATGGLIR